MAVAVPAAEVPVECDTQSQDVEVLKDGQADESEAAKGVASKRSHPASPKPECNSKVRCAVSYNYPPAFLSTGNISTITNEHLQCTNYIKFEAVGHSL